MSKHTVLAFQFIPLYNPSSFFVIKGGLIEIISKQNGQKPIQYKNAVEQKRGTTRMQPQNSVSQDSRQTSVKVIRKSYTSDKYKHRTMKVVNNLQNSYQQNVNQKESIQKFQSKLYQTNTNNVQNSNKTASSKGDVANVMKNYFEDIPSCRTTD